MEGNTTASITNRKRTKRPSKQTHIEENVNQMPTLSPQGSGEQINVSPLGISSASEDAVTGSLTERRRSSRKKVIKFDVRDLLNKNRKTHKIQIEARIDSNAPSDNKICISKINEGGLTSSLMPTVTSEELSVKKKNFMEKSAIFRRYSISAEQPKQPPQLPILPLLLNEVSDSKKSKPTSSLILAQMENSSVMVRQKKKKKQSGKLQTVVAETAISEYDKPQQKRRGRPPKAKLNPINGGTHDTNATQTSHQTPDSNEAKEIVNQRSPKDATNWKEYKAAMQQSSIKTFPTAISTTNVNEKTSPIASSALEELMSPSTPINISINADEPDITSPPFEEVIVETTTSPPITETNKVPHVEEYTANSTLLSTMEDCKYDDRTDTSTNENAVSFNQSDNTSGSECGNNAPTNNLRSYKFGDKLRVNLKRLSLPKTAPDHFTNTNEEVSGDDFEPYKEIDLNSETSNDIKIITLPEERFYYSPEGSMNATDAIHCDEASEDPIPNDISSVTTFDTSEQIIRESNKEECTDSQVVSDGTFETDLIVIDDSSSNVYLPLEKMQYEHYDSKSHLQTPDDKENNHTEESLQSLCANQFEQAAQDNENNVDTISGSSNEKLILFEMGDSSNVTQISEVTHKTIEDFSINVINQPLEVSVLKDDTNAEASSREKEKKKEVRSEIKQSSLILSKKGRKSRFKNLHSPDLDIDTNNEVNESSIESLQCATNVQGVTQTSKNENDETTKFFQKKKIELLEELNIVECSKRNTDDDNMSRGSDINVTNEKQKKSPESDVIVLPTAVEKPKDFEVVVTKSPNDAPLNPIQCSSSCAENVQSPPSPVSTSRLETKLDTSVVHQVHIETNTLLDILRQVQCNNEANEIINKKAKESHCKLHETCEVHPTPTPTPSTQSNTLSVDFQNTTASLKEGTLDMERNESSNVNDKRDEGSGDESGRTKTNSKDSKIPYKNMCREDIIEKAPAASSECKIENYKEIECFEVILTPTFDKSKEIEFCSPSPDKSYSYEDNTQSITQHATPEVISTAVGEHVLKNMSITSNTSTPSIQKNEVKHIQPIQHGTKKHHNLSTEVDLKRVKKVHSKNSKNCEQDSLLINKSELPQSDSNSLTSSSPKKGKKLKNKSETHSKHSKKKSDTIETKTKLMQNSKQQVTNEIKNQYQDKGREADQDEGVSTTENPLEEKIAKKRRQSKLKEAFEAALSDDVVKKESVEEANLNISPKPVVKEALVTESIKEAISVPSNPSNMPTDVEDDPDPLKDIEKFIEDGVNLLKKDYKIDEDSINIVMPKKPSEKIAGGDAEEEEQQVDETSIESKQHSICIKEIVNTFETPADTPIATPTVTPPPRSPTVDDANAYITPDSEENCGVRRSHRIKQITKTPKALVGRGLVRDRERFSIKDDVETKSHYTLDDHLTDLAEVEAKNAKFLKDMEERLSNFQVIKENEYKCEMIISREAKKMICDCFLTIEEEERGELGCGEDCLNRLLMIECGPDCNVKERCTNKRFQKFLSSPCRVFRTEKKGFGIMADIEILPGEFIMEYVGEVIDGEEFEQRRVMYSLDKNRHYYFMALRSDAIIDATIKGNISRFINHSCDPNAETQKWTVNGELRIGFFSRKSIMPGEEITFDYQYQRYGREAQRCYCESTNCRGWIGQEPTSDEGEQVYDDSDYEEDEEEEEDSPNLLVGEDDDEEDSDASGADPEEVQKKLERAAAEAEAELAPIALDESKMKELQKSKKLNDLEDSKSKFKNLLNKMAERVAAKQKQNKREFRMQRKQKTKKKANDLPLSNKQRSLEDPDIEDEVEFLKRCGVKNQSDTLRLSRLMVRAKLVQTRLNLLEILCKGELPCRRLFLDYHGLRLVHGWMSEDGGNMQIRLALLQTLETLPIANKSVLTDTKVLQVVRSWCGHGRYLSPNDDSSKESCGSTSNYQDSTGNAVGLDSSDSSELQKLASKLVSTWEGLPEIFRIPKKERIEQMKEHEREADRQYAASAQNDGNKNLTSESYHRDRFGRGISSTYNRFVKPNNVKSINTVTNSSNTNRLNDEITKNLSKAQRRKMFAAKVAREEAGKRMAEERREFETKCRFFGLDPKNTRPQDVPFCVNQFTGQWYSLDRKPISTPPIYAHVQLPVKPKSTDPTDYQLPAVVATLPPQWKYTITTQGKIYYYHIKYRIPQWDPPTAAQLKHCELEMNDADSEIEMIGAGDSSDDDDDILIGMNAAQLKAYIDKKVEDRRQKRYQRLVDERPISPRREEDRIYNQMEVRKYKENKEKIRKRKEGIRRKRAEALRQSALNMCALTDGANTSASTASSKSNDDDGEASPGMLPIQDYLLSSDEENDIKAECNNSPLIDKIVEGDKIVDELDALTTKRQLKRILPPHRNLDEPSTSSTSNLCTVEKQEYKKRKLDKKDKRKNKESDAKYRKLKEKFRCEIAGIIVHHLKPYRKDTCTIGRIQSNEDFNHLARKLTHFVMIKELKYCESVGQTLIVTESVKNKSREFIKKYMAKYGGAYIKPANDPEFKDIPYTL